MTLLSWLGDSWLVTGCLNVWSESPQCFSVAEISCDLASHLFKGQASPIRAKNILEHLGNIASTVLIFFLY